MDEERDQLNRFDAMGEQKVRLLLKEKQFNREVTRLAIDWLAPKDQELARLREASQAEQTEIARSASDAAWAAARAAQKANRTAIIAAKSQSFQLSRQLLAHGLPIVILRRPGGSGKRQ